MIDRTTIIRGPCKITYDGATFYTREGVTLTLNRNVSAVPVDGCGTVDQYFTGLTVTAEFTPHGSLLNTALNVLFSCVNLNPGASLYGATDKPLVIVSASETVTILNAAITRPPGLLMQAGRPPLNSVQFTGLLANNADPSLLASYITTGAGGAVGTAINRSTMYSGKWAAEWAPAVPAGWPESFYSEGGFEVAVTLGLSPVNVDGIGAVNMSLTNIEAQVRCIPIGITPAQLRQAMAPVGPGKSTFYGQPGDVPAGALAIFTDTGTDDPPSYFSFSADLAALATGTQRWKVDQNRNGQIAFNLLRKYNEVGETIDPLFTLDGVPAPAP